MPEGGNIPPVQKKTADNAQSDARLLDRAAALLAELAQIAGALSANARERGDA